MRQESGAGNEQGGSDEGSLEEGVVDPTGEAIGRVLLELRNSIRVAEPSPSGDAGSADGTDGEEVARELGRVAQRVRRWRDEAELSLQELARRSGVAASTIQKVETQQMIPTVAVLLKIARGLERSPSEFVGSPGEEASVIHLRPEDRHPIGTRARMVVERMVGDLFEPFLEVWRITHEPGSGSGRGRIRYDGEVLIVGEQGVLTVRIGDGVYRVSAGDTLHFKAALAYEWRNDGDEVARVLVIGTLPAILRSSLHQRIRERKDGRRPPG